MKRGFAGDLIFMLVLFFVMAIFFVAIAYVASKITNTGDANVDRAAALSYSGLLQFDWIAPLMIVALGIALIGSTFLIRTHPIFFLGLFLINLCFGYAAMFMANSWQSIFSGNALGTFAQTNFTQWTAVFQYFPFLAIILGIVFAIALFAKGGE